MSQRPKSAQPGSSKFEQNFQKRQLYKRNKRYVNFNKMNSTLLEHSILRRRPLGTEDEHVSQKFQGSFMNSTAELTDRVDKDIGKYKSRISLSARGNTSDFQPNSNQLIFCSSQNDEEVRQKSFSKSARSFSIQKMTSRAYHDKIKNKPCGDQRQFSNFQPFSPSKSSTVDFNNMKGKVLDNTIYHLNNELQYNTQQLYQEYYYSNASTYCKVNYKAEKNLARGRKFFESKRPENEPATQLDLAKVDKGMNIATNFKGSNISQVKTVDFYRGAGKSLPSQSDMRYMNELTNHWVDEQGKIIRKKLDYGTRKMKGDMVVKRNQEITGKKKPQIDRAQICDKKFFTYNQK